MENARGNQWLSLWVKPIALDNFCGEDASFSEEFEALKAEVDKNTSIHTTGGTDWVIVLRMASEFLATKSKNIWALGYAVYAFYQINGFSECSVAFATLIEILTSHWDSLYPLPERMQRRLAPLQWLCTRMETSARSSEFIGENPQCIAALMAECERLQDFLNSKTGDLSPSFTGIFKKIPVLEAIPPDNDKALSSPIPSSPTSSNTRPIATVLTELDADGRVPTPALPQLVRNVIEHNRQLAGHLLSLNLLDERAYQLHRTALWSTLLQLPQSDHSGKTQLSCGVPKDKIQTYAAALEDKRYAEILPNLERSTAKAPFWLDGHHMVARCLEGLGATAALDCVRTALSQLTGRFPELQGYKFKCGTPFASPETISWLETLSNIPHSAKQPYVAMVAGGNGNETSRREARLREAIGICQEQNFQAGLLHLGTVSSGRNRTAIQHGMLQARYCMATGKRKAAVTLLHALYDQLEQWGLLDWEPELTASLLFLLCSAPPKRHGVTEDMIRRLHWLNIDIALNVFPEQ
jgi:type VI secretion system protein VasJ